MKPLETLIAVALFAATMLASPTAVRAEDLAADPLSWNFGEVAVGTSVARSFGFTSIGTSDVSIYLLQVTANDSLMSPPVCGVDVACDFAITASPGLPLIMPPGDTTAVEVTFTPSAIGPAHAFLYVRSNDTYPPPGSVAYLPLTGVGGAPAPAPAASPWALAAMALALTAAAAVALKRMAR